MAQSKRASLAEAIGNMLIGQLVAWCIAMVVFPMFGYPVTGCHAFEMNLIFTAASLIRSYWMRRIFNRLSA